MQGSLNKLPVFACMCTIHQRPCCHFGVYCIRTFRCRWQSFVPQAKDDSSAASVALWTQSLALLQQGWPELPLRLEEVSSLEAAQLLFMRLLAGADQADQLELLGRLLGNVWQNGRVFPHQKACS